MAFHLYSHAHGNFPVEEDHGKGTEEYEDVEKSGYGQKEKDEEIRKRQSKGTSPKHFQRILCRNTGNMGEKGGQGHGSHHHGCGGGSQ